MDVCVYNVHMICIPKRNILICLYMCMFILILYILNLLKVSFWKPRIIVLFFLI